MPGATALTRIPSPASSFDRPRVRMSTPALAAAYWTYSCGEPVVPAADEMLTIAPP
jgi:hypothetical protein